MIGLFIVDDVFVFWFGNVFLIDVCLEWFIKFDVFDVEICVCFLFLWEVFFMGDVDIWMDMLFDVIVCIVVFD